MGKVCFRIANIDRFRRKFRPFRNCKSRLLSKNFGPNCRLRFELLKRKRSLSRLKFFGKAPLNRGLFVCRIRRRFRSGGGRFLASCRHGKGGRWMRSSGGPSLCPCWFQVYRSPTRQEYVGPVWFVNSSRPSGSRSDRVGSPKPARWQDRVRLVSS